MVTFTRSQSVWLNRVPFVPAWSMCQRAKVPNACQFLIFTCQCANKRTKGVNIGGGGGGGGELKNFSVLLSISKFQEYLAILENK